MSLSLQTRNAVDSLRLPAKVLERILQELGSQKERRACQRVPYQIPNGTVIRIEQADNPPVVYRVYPYNLGSGGIGLLNGTFVCPETRCTIVLKTTDGTNSDVRGVISRCHLIRGRVHEIGVRFDKAIDLNKFVVAQEEPKAQQT